MHRNRGAALIEFALAWPIALLLALGAVETAVWGSETFAAHSAALAGARAAATAGGTPALAVAVTRRILAPSLVGVTTAAWCPGDISGLAGVVGLRDAIWATRSRWKSAARSPPSCPLAGTAGLPLHARAVVQKEMFAR